MAGHTAVLLKRILDPELPASRFEIDASTKRPPPGLGSELLGPFEQSALEVGLQLRDAGGTGRVTAIAAGPAGSIEALRKALAVRVDDVVLVRLGDDDQPDPSQTAELLCGAVGRLDSVDLVLAGRQGGDWDHGQVGYLVAERLGWPCVGLVQRVGVEDGRLVLERDGPQADEAFSVRPPAVATVTNDEANRLRMARVLDLMAAGKQPVTEWTPRDLGLDDQALADLRRLELVDVWVPEVESNCEFIPGEEPAEVAAQLFARLGELKVLTGVGE